MARRVEIDGWASGIRFSACHMIPGHGKCGRMHGHTYAIHVRIKGRPNDQHMIADFQELKEALKEVCQELDHRVLVPSKSPEVEIARDGGDVVVKMSGKSYTFPEEDVTFLEIPAATAEALARYVLDRIEPRIKQNNVEEIEVGLDEGMGQGAWARNTY